MSLDVTAPPTPPPRSRLHQVPDAAAAEGLSRGAGGAARQLRQLPVPDAGLRGGEVQSHSGLCARGLPQDPRWGGPLCRAWGPGRPGADSEGGLSLAASRPLVSTFRARGGSRVAVTGSDPAGPPRPPAVTHDHRDGVVEFSWKRHRLFSHTACLVLYQLCMEVGGLGAHPPRVRSLALAGGGGTRPSLN